MRHSRVRRQTTRKMRRQFSRRMEDRRIFITYGENWDENEYRGGISEMFFVPPKLTYESLLRLVHKSINADLSCFVYDLQTVLRAC
ncbi:hypothetical protein DITRI_Ditri02bG0103000 [Diplodiscus trichospermus]